MKTIFRYANFAFLLAVLVGIGTVAGYAQNPCEDAEGMAATDAKFRENYNKGLAERIVAVEAGKQYLEKYANCGEINKDVVDWLRSALPKIEEGISAEKAKREKDLLYGRFNKAVEGKNWDEVYASGREILSKEPDQLDVMITLGSIGYDELFEGRTNFKYNDDTLRYARQAIAAMDSGKSSPSGQFGLYGWSFKNKAATLAELNLTIGYLTQVALKNKKDAAPYLYKVTQSSTAAAKNPIPYELIGRFYFDELNALVEKIKTAEAAQSPDDTPEVAQKKVDDLKALVALANGTAERAMDAFSRAFTNAEPKAVDYRKQMKANIEAAYKLRFGKVEGVDSWIAGVVSKPFPNPTSPITPVSDPEPATNTTSSGPAAIVTPAAAATPVKTDAAAKGKLAPKQKPSAKTVAKKKGM